MVSPDAAEDGRHVVGLKAYTMTLDLDQRKLILTPAEKRAASMP